MSQMTETDRNQLTRYDLKERPRMTALSAGGTRGLAILTVALLTILAVLTYAAVQVFDGWPHLIVIADIVIVFFAIAAWIYSMRPVDQAEDGPRFIPLGMRAKSK